MKSFLRIMIIFMGILLGMFLGELATQVSWLDFLAFGTDIGLSKPIELDLGVLTLTFAFMFKLNIAGILGFIASIFVIKKVI
ncbi:MAG: DUF4321 domain-containing protein [Clostridia bacterium]|nr:DUF4321 domain-containing protein [Clostridia bacterium]MDD4375455.1 DUF4321 domain-containing protein [Clostridia bacterium]